MIRDAVLAKVSREFSVADGPPFVIIGMHRSGTSMVTRILRQAGGYFGWRLDPNSEAIVFLRLNHSFLRYANASWHFFTSQFQPENLARNPKVILCFLSNKNLLWSEYFAVLGKPGVEGLRLRGEAYRLPLLNLKGILHFGSRRIRMGQHAVPFWGWKDPRTTMTLPFWLKVFPNAKVIHVVRNGMDAALSLWRRSQKSGEGAPHCLDLHYCFALWEKYVREGCKWRSLGHDRYIEVRYEDLLRDPAESLEPLLSFSGASVWDVQELTSRVDRGRPARGLPMEWDSLIERATCSEIFRDLGYGK